jgi:hypothetical protein
MATGVKGREREKEKDCHRQRDRKIERQREEVANGMREGEDRK